MYFVLLSFLSLNDLLVPYSYTLLMSTFDTGKRKTFLEHNISSKCALSESVDNAGSTGC